ncbi:hypothetical protein MRB53_015643 [Persea americana]|uniref:Uncharacterized protein n=1 Tax=Persea americana TaxID=3435 RepID=A0ACC2LZS9_PERAE|nr:hypothetical protein MRB53_015643 [Persea americana]
MSGEKLFVGVEETMEEDKKKCHPSPKMDRKTVEKRRRIQMKTLYSKLNSLIPHHHHSRDVPMLSDQLDEAINHIKTLQEDLEKMKERRKSLMGMDEINKRMNMGTAIGLQPTRIEIQDLGSTMVVLLISGLDNQLIFYKSICVLEEEGAEVVNASFYIMDDKVFHTIHCKISDCELGYKGAKISGRLHELVHEISSNL